MQNRRTVLLPFNTFALLFLKGGQYIGLTLIAAMDGINGALVAGKRARNKPDDGYKPGDFVRGVAYGLSEVNKKGAMRRGKTDADYYDDDGRVKVDVGDFATGATVGTREYVAKRKAKFIGGAVAAATVITLTVFAGPWIGMGIALVAGAGTEIAVNKIDEAIRKKTGDVDKQEDDDDEEDSAT